MPAYDVRALPADTRWRHYFSLHLAVESTFLYSLHPEFSYPRCTHGSKSTLFRLTSDGSADDSCAESTDPNNGQMQKLKMYACHLRQLDEYALILLLTNLTSDEYFYKYEVCFHSLFALLSFFGTSLHRASSQPTCNDSPETASLPHTAGRSLQRYTTPLY